MKAKMAPEKKQEKILRENNNIKKYISPQSGGLTCTDPADVVKKLVNGFSCQVLKFMEGLQGQ